MLRSRCPSCGLLAPFTTAWRLLRKPMFRIVQPGEGSSKTFLIDRHEPPTIRQPVNSRDRERIDDETQGAACGAMSSALHSAARMTTAAWRCFSVIPQMNSKGSWSRALAATDISLRWIVSSSFAAL